MSDTLFDLDPTQFQMQQWRSTAEGWEPMEEGVAPKVWQPRSTAEEAVHKCLEWTGTICIPAMRVVDLSSGDVVWQDTSRYPKAGESVMPSWAPAMYDRVRAEQRAASEVSA